MINCTDILNDKGKVLDKEQYIAVLIAIIKNKCTKIGQMYLNETTPAHLTEVSLPEVSEEGEILIKLRILITYYKIVAVMTHENNKKMLRVKSFGVM